MRFLFRAFIILLASVTVAWSAWIFPLEHKITPLRDIAERIVLRQTFSLDRLSPVLKYLDETQPQRGCGTGADEAAVIRLYAAAVADSGQLPAAKELLIKARDQTVAALTCSPHQGFLWYALFWIEKALGFSSTRYFELLELSYELAPNEGWVARFRNPDSLELYAALNSELRNKVRAEYKYLVRDRTNVAVATLGDAPPHVRATILNILEELPLETRERFAKQVDAANLLIDIPGVDYRRARR